jgi:bifunctional UDP-N-acetylglucosamine pyrophosphorylase/glucosamine-1-phosphate N-acetyltransferase
MKALLLLAGQSRRFWPLCEKALFPILGKTLLERQVEQLFLAGISDVTLIGGTHNIDQAKILFPSLPVIRQHDLSLGMRGALLDALPQCENGPVLIVSSNDIVTSEAYRSVLQRMQEGNIDGALLAQRVQRYFPGGYLTLEGDRVIGIVEKPLEEKQPSDLVNVVVHAHRSAAQLLEILKDTESVNDDAYEVALASLCRTSNYVAIPYEGLWHPVKYPWHLLPLLERLLGEEIRKSTISPSVAIHPTAVLQGNVFLGEDVKIYPHATIIGPAYIGKGSIVANNALVRGSSIGENCVVGFCTEVKSSVLSDHVWTHMNYIGDSIVGRNVSFGAGCITGNLRLDEEVIHTIVAGGKVTTHLKKFGTAIGDNCRLGINVSINPGVKIGSGSFIGSAVLVSKDIPENTFVTQEPAQLSLRKNTANSPTTEVRGVLKKALQH